MAWSQQGDFEMKRDWVSMPDGVKLSVTVFQPVTTEPVPVLLELLPYRKDDMFYQRDYPLGAYFARHGYAVVRADVRGTGSSEGTLPSHEYSDQEINDAINLVEHYAALPWSNGKVGMYGISWSGFNAIHTAMRKPQALKAILAVDASDDLFHDDVHFLDGCYHMDRYELEIDNDNGLPESLNYRIDEDYFRERFDREPWLMAYLRQQTDGEFWRRKSVRFQKPLEVPTYLIGGLLDFYRDSVPRMLETTKAPVIAEIGPWNHAWPDNGEPGPNYDWRRNLLGWWDHWLKGVDTGVQEQPELTVFLRDSHPPDDKLSITPGRWVSVEWPPQLDALRFYPTSEQRLDPDPATPSQLKLEYKAGSGLQAGQWWGEPTGDMAADDKEGLVFDSPPLEEPLEIVGFPRVRWRASVDAPLAHWIARLEDLSPDGQVSLVTGAALNGSAREDRLRPSALKPGKKEDYDIDLHFTTWTFPKGHRIRLVLTNAQFPMIWPTPHRMTSTTELGSATWLELPRARTRSLSHPLPPPEPREHRTDARDLEGGGWPLSLEAHRDAESGLSTWRWKGESRFAIEQRSYHTRLEIVYGVNDKEPDKAWFEGSAHQHIELEEGRVLDYTTLMEVRSDLEHFHATVERRLKQNGAPVRERRWRESFPRVFQ